MTPHPTDRFDVFGEYPDVHPVSVAEAAEKFREAFKEVSRLYHESNVMLSSGSSSVAYRAEVREKARALMERAEVRLFRSVMAEGDDA